MLQYFFVYFGLTASNNPTLCKVCWQPISGKYSFALLHTEYIRDSPVNVHLRCSVGCYYLGHL